MFCPKLQFTACIFFFINARELDTNDEPSGGGGGVEDAKM